LRLLAVTTVLIAALALTGCHRHHHHATNNTAAPANTAAG